MTQTTHHCNEGTAKVLRRKRGHVAYIGASVVFLSLVVFIISAPINPVELTVEQRFLATTQDPVDYFKDKPEDYYQKLREIVHGVGLTGLKAGKAGSDPEVIIITPTPPPIGAALQVQEPTLVPAIQPTKSLLPAPSPTPAVQPREAPITLPATRGKPENIVVGSRSEPVSTPSFPPQDVQLPKVFSFYTQRESNLLENDNSLMSKWKENWKNAGYNPQILTIDDAAKHPEYGQYKDALQAVLYTSNVRKPQELLPCYQRYLAMAVMGGGMMVDLDMTPKSDASFSNVTKSIPGKFTMYCNFDTPDPKVDWVKQVETQNGLPCAVVAGADEWYRVGKLMGWAANEYRDQQVWTDAHALQLMTATGEVNLAKEEIAQSWRTSGWDRCHFRYV